MSAAISRFKLPETLDDVPSDIRDAMLAVQEKAGFVPNVFLMLAHRPEEFRTFLGMSNRLVTLAGRPPNSEFYLMGRVPKKPDELVRETP